MKTLIISIYDGGYRKSAAVYENGELTELSLTNRELNLFVDRHWLKVNSQDSEKAQADLERLNTMVNEYDQVIVCEDGEIERLK